MILINNDNAGNSYFGGRANNLIYAPGSVGVTTQQITDWINGFFEQTCAIPLNDNINLILPISFESLSLPVTANKARFELTVAGRICSANTNVDLEVSNRVGGAAGSMSFNDPNAETVVYAVLNNKSLNVFQIKRIGGSLDNSSYTFLSLGWLSNPLFPGGAFPRNAYFLVINSNASLNGAFRPLVEGTNGRQLFEIPTNLSPNSIVNYPVNCQVSTPGANATEFYLRDNVAPNKAIGYVPNVLKTSLNIPVGNIYRNTQPDPDGSNQIDWMCVGLIGSERLLMRVWTQGLTS